MQCFMWHTLRSEVKHREQQSPLQHMETKQPTAVFKKSPGRLGQLDEKIPILTHSVCFLGDGEIQKNPKHITKTQTKPNQTHKTQGSPHTFGLQTFERLRSSFIALTYSAWILRAGTTKSPSALLMATRSAISMMPRLMP